MPLTACRPAGRRAPGWRDRLRSGHRPQGYDDLAGMRPPGAAGRLHAAATRHGWRYRSRPSRGGSAGGRLRFPAARRKPAAGPGASTPRPPRHAEHQGTGDRAAGADRADYKEIGAQLFISRSRGTRCGPDPPAAGPTSCRELFGGTCRSCSPRRMERTNGGLRSTGRAARRRIPSTAAHHSPGRVGERTREDRISLNRRHRSSVSSATARSVPGSVSSTSPSRRAGSSRSRRAAALLPRGSRERHRRRADRGQQAHLWRTRDCRPGSARPRRAGCGPAVWARA